MAGVGSSVIFEDDKIKVWEFYLKPGEQTPVHTHEHDYVFYVINGSSLDVLDANDKFLTTFDLPEGTVLPLRLDDNELVVVNDESQRIPATHSARNAGPRLYREILIEKK
ncbi:MAG: hypothetical protein P8R42_08790 [Candidatus Binatia bacterium]|nr:hypothetical protein [Candidatus Binatia bacterium]